MRLVEVLNPEAIRTDLAAQDKDGTLRELARIFAESDGLLDAEAISRVFSDRERLASTGVGSGVAIPHGRLEIEYFHAVMAICPRGVPFDSIDGEPARIFFAVLGPQKNPAEQLKVLARISRLLKDEAVRARLLSAPDRQAAFDILAEEELRH
jgi:PTS system nitrogen regulatory IIA component